jgi:hypothetical protein
MTTTQPETVTVPKHSNGDRFSVQFFTVEGTNLGPYVALPLNSWWTSRSAHLFTRATAEMIVRDLHREECGITGAFAADGALTFTVEPWGDEPGRTAVVRPDAYGRYKIGDLWDWDMWPDHCTPTVGQEAYAKGAAYYREADETEAQDEPLRALYARGRAEAHALTLHMEECPDDGMIRALAAHGVKAYPDDDSGNSWLRIPFGQPEAWDGSGPHLVAYVMLDDDTEGEVIVDEPIGDRAAHWYVNRATGYGRESRLLESPYSATDQVAAVIAALAKTPQRHTF